MAIPDEQPLIAAIKAIREEEPGLARAKVLKRLKEENNWEYVLVNIFKDIGY